MNGVFRMFFRNLIVFVYLYDIVVFSENIEYHKKWLDQSL